MPSMNKYIPLFYMAVVSYPYPDTDAGLANLCNQKTPKDIGIISLRYISFKYEPCIYSNI